MGIAVGRRIVLVHELRGLVGLRGSGPGRARGAVIALRPMLTAMPAPIASTSLLVNTSGHRPRGLGRGPCQAMSSAFTRS